MSISWVEDDGGRAAAGYSGEARDCVTRAIAIAEGRPYLSVYADLFLLGGRSPRNGVKPEVYKDYLSRLEWEWVPTMKLGSGCRVHLTHSELPKGRIIVRLSKHIAAVIDGVLHDTWDCSRGGTRCVYGYWKKRLRGDYQ